MPRFESIRLAVLLPALMALASAHATVIIDNFGAGNSHGVNVFPVAGATAHAFAFTVTSSYTLDGIDLAVFLYQGVGPNAGVVEIRADASGKPGAVLETWSVNGLLPEVVSGNPSGSTPPVSLLSQAHPVLTAGDRYWVDAREPSSTGGWYDSALGIGLFDSQTSTGGASWTAASMQGNPGALRILGTVVSVPEAASHALMLGGLGLLGVALSRRAPWRPARSEGLARAFRRALGSTRLRQGLEGT